jgi:hypothetical protein
MEARKQLTMEVVDNTPEAIRGILTAFFGNGQTEKYCLEQYAQDPELWREVWDLICNSVWKENVHGDWECGEWVYLVDERGVMDYDQQLITKEEYDERQEDAEYLAKENEYLAATYEAAEAEYQRRQEDMARDPIPTKEEKEDDDKRYIEDMQEADRKVTAEMEQEESDFRNLLIHKEVQ